MKTLLNTKALGISAMLFEAEASEGDPRKAWVESHPFLDREVHQLAAIDVVKRQHLPTALGITLFRWKLFLWKTAKPALRFDHPEYFPCRCPKCGWQGMSNQCAGGEQIADTGDCADAVCPICIDPVGDYENSSWVPVEEIRQPNDQDKE